MSTFPPEPNLSFSPDRTKVLQLYKPSHLCRPSASLPGRELKLAGKCLASLLWLPVVHVCMLWAIMMDGSLYRMRPAQAVVCTDMMHVSLCLSWAHDGVWCMVMHVLTPMRMRLVDWQALHVPITTISR